jgi:hypothetical protein
MSTGKVDQSKIAVLAEELWHNAGRPDGRDLEFWLEAEKTLGAAQTREPRAVIHVPANDVVAKGQPASKASKRNRTRN